MKVQVCVHHPLNPKKSKRCIERSGHFGQWITELDLPFVDELNLAAWSLANMASCDDISDDDIPKLYDEIKNDVLSKRGPEKAGLCVKLLAHENNETTDLVMPFADDPNQLSSALDNMVKEKYISAKAKRKIYEQIKRETLDKCLAEMRHTVWTLPEPPVVQGNGLNLNDPRIKEIVVKYQD